jgi:lipase
VGRRDGRPLLHRHGLNPFGALQLNEAGPLLARCGFRVVAVAAPGMGDAPALDDPDDYLPTRLAAHVTATADGLDIDRFVFMGHSWGGSIGVHLAAEHAERVEALVLLDAGHTDVPERSREELEREFATDHAELVFESWDAFLDAARSDRATWSPALEERYRAGMTERDGRIVARVDPQAAAWALHGADVRTVEAGHDVLGDAPAETIAVVSDWLG